MYDPTYGPTSLDRHLRKSDFRLYPDLKVPAERQKAIQAAVKVAERGLFSIPLVTNNFAGQNIYQVDDLPTEIVLRKAAQNLQVISKTKQSNRIEIIRRLRLLCEEGMPFIVAKFDIKSFYRSVDQPSLKQDLNKRLITAPSTRFVLNTFVDDCAAKGILGLPLGLAISAALSELFMQDFDRRIRKNLQTYFYARYVDDIVMVLPPESNRKVIRKSIIDALPNGLALNNQKSQVMEFSNAKKKKPEIEHVFNYLGFQFTVYQTVNIIPYERWVCLDIASSKIKKRKTRMVKSVLQFLKDGNFVDLYDRFKLITCNYRFFDHRNSVVRLAGLKHAYGLIDASSDALQHLDNFQRMLILNRTGKIGRSLSSALTNNQRKMLLSLSFTRGFENDTHFHFSCARLKFLIDCWKYA